MEDEERGVTDLDVLLRSEEEFVIEPRPEECVGLVSPCSGCVVEEADIEDDGGLLEGCDETAEIVV